MKSIAILQSNYIPWKGYFDIMRSVDEFVIYDDAQYTRRDWRNRNIIKTKDGPKWLTIPVIVKGKYNQKINETRIADKSWSGKHWEIIKQNYISAPYFNILENIFEKAYVQCGKMDLLSEVNRHFINTVNSILGINTTITDTSKFCMEGNKSEKILSVCKQENAQLYISGPSAKEYIDDKIFSAANVSIRWIDYKGYPEYVQRYPPFKHSVSIIDVLFNCGQNSFSVMKTI